jgi:hypothetical protein
VESFEAGVESFVVSGESSEARGPGEASFHDPSSWQRDEASFGHGVLDDFKLYTVLQGGFGRVRTGVALVDISQIDRMTGDLLHPGQCGDLRTVAVVCGRDLQRHQMAQRIDRDMDLRALAPLGSVVACPRAALRRRLQRAAVQTDRRRLVRAPTTLTQKRLDIRDQNLEHTRFHPASHLLIHRRPRRQIVRHVPPLVASPYDITAHR